MSDNRMALLVKRLVEKTNKKELAWEATAAEDEFAVAFSSYAVTVSHDPDEDEYLVTLSDSGGQVIDELSPSDFESYDLNYEDPAQVFALLYSEARRTAMGIDEALDSILAELD